MAASEEEEALVMCMLMLEGECTVQEYRTSLQTLQRILQNIKSDPTNEKYRTLRKENKTFNHRVWRLEGAQQFMLAIGWIEVDDTIILAEDTKLDLAINVIQEQLSSLPVEIVPTQSTQEEANSTWSDKELREKERKITEQRQRMLNRLQREKEEKKRIADQIKADRQESNTREVKDARAKEVKFGANIKKFKDIGVDVNQGGG